MKPILHKRLDRLEAQLAKTADGDIGLKRYDFKMAVMSILGFHNGRFAEQDSLAGAIACALDMSPAQLKAAILPDGEMEPEVWQKALEKLNMLVGEQGRRLENVWYDSLGVTGSAYDEIPQDLKEIHHLLPYLSDYLV